MTDAGAPRPVETSVGTQGAVYHQTFDRVQTVTNVSTTQQFLITDVREPLPDDALLAPMLLNRAQHSRLIGRTLFEMRRGGYGATLIVVPGCADDRHEALVQRCSKIELPGSAPGPWKSARSLPWPDWRGATVTDIVEEVAEALSLGRGLTREETEAAIGAIPEHICISHLVDSSRWESDSGSLVAQWVDYVASRALRPAEGYLLVAFLCLEVKERPTRTCRRILRFLETVRRQKAADAVLVTPPLDPIRSVHVREWSDNIPGSPQFPSLRGTSFADLPDLLFPSPTEELRLGAILPKVTEQIAARLPGRPRFKEINP